ncbi:MAG: DEAD/DEAH box helicase [Ignavibacteria bacterium]|nr:DEAD/DEAH box helicase [Ignavibacteria bacterium]
MLFNARPYQVEAEKNVYSAWNRGYKNVLLSLPTGSGKTFIFSRILRKHNGPSCAIAHRQELISQMSVALAREGVYHRIITKDKSLVTLCTSLQMAEIGKRYYDASAPCTLVGIKTLNNQADALRQWGKSLPLWIMDEAHHILRENEWGIVNDLFPNARGLGVTATAERTDGKGLGANFEGVFHALINGPCGRQLINMGYLTDYRIFVPPSDLDLSDVPTGKDGDYTAPRLKIAVRRSRIIGDIVAHYKRLANGLLGITFATDVQTAGDIRDQFRSAGVPAEMVHAKTPDRERIAAIRKFKNREILQLVNVDLFGEGFDLPAVQVVSFGRPTQSHVLYVQQFGRGLRIMIDSKLMEIWDSFTNEQRRGFIASSIKPRAMIIDHVGNVPYHGLPDYPRKWSLASREKCRHEKRIDEEPVKICTNPTCNQAYSKFLRQCPYCGNIPIPSARSSPDFVDGDLLELDENALSKLQFEKNKMDMQEGEYLNYLYQCNIPIAGINANMRRHEANQEAQKKLREIISIWAGYQRLLKRPDSESYRRFYHATGIDVLSAQSLPADAANELSDKIIGFFK